MNNTASNNSGTCMITCMKERLKKKCCPCTGAYLPRLIPCAVLGFIFLLGFNFYVHGTLLIATYNETPALWRSAKDMEAFSGFMMVMFFLTAFLTSLIYAKGHEGKGLCEGIRFGILIGLLIGVLNASPYAWMPISEKLAQAWFLAGLVQGIGLGIIYSLLYKSSCAKSCCGDGSCGKGACKCAQESSTKTGCCDTTGKTSACSTSGETKTGCC